MSVVLDIITLLIITGIVWQSYKSGFLHTVISLVGTVVALVAALSLATPVGNWIYTTFLKSALTAWVSSAVSSQTSGTTDAAGSIAAALQTLVPSVDLSALVQQGAAQAQSAAVAAVVAPLGQSIGHGIAFVLLFALFSAAVHILARLSTALSRVPVLGLLNRLGGGVLGFFKAAIILFVICTLFAALLPSLAYTGFPITERTVSETYVLSRFYDANPLRKIL